MSSKFYGADFGMAAFGTCQLMGSKLINCNLASSTFFGSYLEDLTVENCILDGVRLEEGENGTVNVKFLAGLTTTFLPYANDPKRLKELSPSQFKKVFKQKLNELPEP